MEKRILNYYYALKNMYVDDINRKDCYTLIKSHIIDDGIWNFICNLNVRNINEIQDLLDLNRNSFINSTPRFYILQDEPISNMIKQIKEKYNLYCKDSWFCTNLKDLDLNYKSKISININISKNKNEVIDTIMKGFSTGDPNDPYGDLSPLYRCALETNWNKMVRDYKSIHYIAYFNNQPVSIATATFKKDYAYLNNVTTLKEYKGMGIAKELLTFLINDLKNKNINYIVFATETGEYTEAFYKKLGFKIINYGYCFEEK